jgi:hypothetical protein
MFARVAMDGALADPLALLLALRSSPLHLPPLCWSAWWPAVVRIALSGLAQGAGEAGRAGWEGKQRQRRRERRGVVCLPPVVGGRGREGGLTRTQLGWRVGPTRQWVADLNPPHVGEAVVAPRRPKQPSKPLRGVNRTI